MTRPRYPKTDANQSSLITRLEGLGFTVVDVSCLPTPALDLFVGGWSERQQTYAWVQVEVKTEGGSLNENEERYLARNPDLPILVVRQVEDVLDWFGRRAGGERQE